ncbi:hypothetical protein, partial [Marivita cryptomonadis]|uniref:hypothetical protein n=1 Tax=Marivita cryptomonadis TaxID=505252 RepID=UPI001939583D|nr:hypothetical protein [Marivita cryptomonadis]MBM2410623.1 hypothetical protein [Marivita cryptomonadis]MBM2429299.1 hypothetical protein [Marivita cryptomonadis]MBM2433969.1 hypothetical protein [Marivita cryptomonadis]MBM2438632.1 hypothetical protein [Marivita cryptomonadis]
MMQFVLALRSNSVGRSDVTASISPYHRPDKIGFQSGIFWQRVFQHLCISVAGSLNKRNLALQIRQLLFAILYVAKVVPGILRQHLRVVLFAINVDILPALKDGHSSCETPMPERENVAG